MSLPPRLMSLGDLTPKQINQVVGLARRLKTASRRVLPPSGPVMREAAWVEAVQDPTKLSAPPQSLRNMTIALLFSKRSTRTRVSAETSANLLGGNALFLGKEDIQLGVNESARDTARVLSGMCQGIFARVGDHSEIEELAKYAEVPVINALSSLWHPTQVLADLQTLYEDRALQQMRTVAPNPHTVPYSSPSASESSPESSTSEANDANSSSISEKPVSNPAAAQHRITQANRKIRPLTIAYVGDSANVLHDMLVTYPRLGHKLQIASPPNPRYRAPAPVWDKVVELGCDKYIEWTADPREAVKGADVIVTDTWVSMGQEEEYEQRVKDFQGYQVTEEMCEGANKDWRFLHCLPRKSHEVNDDVFYGPRSLVFREADNRKWTIMALFHIIFGGGSFNALPHGRPRGYQTQPHVALRADDKTKANLSVTDEELKAFNDVYWKLSKNVRQVNWKQSQNKNASAKHKGKEDGKDVTAADLLSAVDREVEVAKQATTSTASVATEEKVPA